MQLYIRMLVEEFREIREQTHQLLRQSREIRAQFRNTRSLPSALPRSPSGQGPQTRVRRCGENPWRLPGPGSVTKALAAIHPSNSDRAEPETGQRRPEQRNGIVPCPSAPQTRDHAI